MPSTVAGLLEQTGLSHGGCVRWNSPVPSQRPGVYLISLTADPEALAAAIARCPLRPAAIQELLRVSPGVQLDCRVPSAGDLAQRISAFWLPDEVVLYIGLASTSLRKRVRQYYKTPIGASKPHAGGWFLKTLSNLDDLHVHYAECSEQAVCEDRLLQAFSRSVSTSTRASLHDAERPMPFANLEWPRGTRKRHGITGARGGPWKTRQR